MHKRKTTDDDKAFRNLKVDKTTTETDFPLSSHPSQVSQENEFGDESLLVVTANNISVATKRKRSK